MVNVTYNRGTRELSLSSPLITNMDDHVMTDLIIPPPDSKTIPLTHGRFAIVDSSDYDWLMRWKWLCNPNGYALRRTRTSEDGEQKNVLMHRQINNTPDGFATDHINGNRLDNRRGNLRTCTDMQNQRNRIKHKQATSLYKGVSRSSRGRNGWETMLYVNNKRQYIGHYASEVDAALAYNEAAKKVFGEFANLNKVVIPPDHVPEVKIPHASIYRGVSTHKKSGRWMAKITFNRKNMWIGMFDNEIDAARAFNAEAIRLGVPHKCNNLSILA